MYDFVFEIDGFMDWGFLEVLRFFDENDIFYCLEIFFFIDRILRF